MIPSVLKKTVRNLATRVPGLGHLYVSMVDGEVSSVRGEVLELFSRSIDFWVKAPAGGNMMHYVFDDLSFLPTCIFIPIFLKSELIMLTPLIKSSRDSKMKAPSSK